MRTGFRSTVWFRGAGLGLLVSGMFCAGCSEPGRPAGRALSAEDFADKSGTARIQGPVAVADPAAVARRPGPAKTMGVGPLTASEGIVNVSALPGPPAVPTAPTTPAERPVLVDALIGFINGTPVYANEFLRDFDARFRSSAKEKTREEWKQEARRAIASTLNHRVETVLLEGEARALLPPEQRQGMRAFAERVRSELRSRNYGSAVRAEQTLSESDARRITEDQFLKDTEKEYLVFGEFERAVSKKVQVSWRDITEYYLKNYETFNPPPTARFRLIHVSSVAKGEGPGGDAVAEVRRRLDAGEAFETVAALKLNRHKSAEGGAYEPLHFKGSFEEATFFGVPELNEAARRLSPGETAGPIVSDTATYWVHLDGIDRESHPLVEVQRSIEDHLHGERSVALENQYVQRLLDRSSLTDINQMTEQLLTIAVDRYLPPEKK